MELTKEAYVQDGQRRMALLDQLMAAKGLDAVLFTSTSQQAYMLAIKYCSGYSVPTRRCFFFKEIGKAPALLVATACQEYHSKIEGFLQEDCIIGGDCASEAIARIRSIAKKNPRVGLYEPAEYPQGFYSRMVETGAEFVDVTYDFNLARQPKSDFEVACIRSASQVATDSFRWVVRNMQPGVTEEQMIGGAEGYIRAHGGTQTLVLVRAERPHTFIARPKDTPVDMNGLFLYSCEMAGIYGYWTQLIRPIFMKKDSYPGAQEILSVIHEAEAAGVEKMRPGNRVCDVAKAIEDVIGKYEGLSMGVWSGHGMGADLGDGIGIGLANEMEIIPNMILTIHPNVQSATDGILYGNTYVATEGAAENLTPDYTDCIYLEDLRAQIG